MLWWKRWGKKLLDIAIIVLVYGYVFFILTSVLMGFYQWIELNSYGLYTQGLIGWLQLVVYILVKASIVCVVIALFVASIAFIVALHKSGKGMLWVKVGDEYVSRFILLQEKTNIPLL